MSLHLQKESFRCCSIEVKLEIYIVLPVTLTAATTFHTFWFMVYCESPSADPSSQFSSFWKREIRFCANEFKVGRELQLQYLCYLPQKWQKELGIRVYVKGFWKTESLKKWYTVSYLVFSFPQRGNMLG